MQETNRMLSRIIFSYQLNNFLVLRTVFTCCSRIKLNTFDNVSEETSRTEPAVAELEIWMDISYMLCNRNEQTLSDIPINLKNHIQYVRDHFQSPRIQNTHTHSLSNIHLFLSLNYRLGQPAHWAHNCHRPGDRTPAALSSDYPCPRSVLRAKLATPEPRQQQPWRPVPPG